MSRSSPTSPRSPTIGPSFRVEPEEFIDAADYIVVREKQRAGNERGSFESRYVHVMKFEDGKPVLGEFLTDSARAAKLSA